MHEESTAGATTVRTDAENVPSVSEKLSWPCVYLMQLGEGGPVKIGSTINAGERWNGLQALTSRQLRLRHLIPCETEEEAREAEKRMLLMYREFRIYGEVFEWQPLKSYFTMDVVIDKRKNTTGEKCPQCHQRKPLSNVQRQAAWRARNA